MEDHCHTLQQQTATLTQQVDDLHREMNKSKERVSQVCSLLEQKEKELQHQMEVNAGLVAQSEDQGTESKKYLQAYEQAVVQVSSVHYLVEYLKTII